MTEKDYTSQRVLLRRAFHHIIQKAMNLSLIHISTVRPPLIRRVPCPMTLESFAVSAPSLNSTVPVKPGTAAVSPSAAVKTST